MTIPRDVNISQAGRRVVDVASERPAPPCTGKPDQDQNMGEGNGSIGESVDAAEKWGNLGEQIM